MITLNKKEPLLLLFGDALFYLLALWLTLLLRYGHVSSSVWNLHIWPFSFLIMIWVVVFFISGLYEKHTVIVQSKIPSILFHTQIVNILIAALFFYFIPVVGITPRTNLFLYIVVSFTLILWWRLHASKYFLTTRKQDAILIGSGREMIEMKEEVNNNPRYNARFVSVINLDEIDISDFRSKIQTLAEEREGAIVVVDLHNEKLMPVLPTLYELVFSRVHFIDLHKFYEDIFDRVPLSVVRDSWFLENISLHPKMTYDFLKRCMDISLSLILGSVALIILPFVYLAIKLDDGGKVFIYQNRVGKNGTPIRIIKFRTLTRDDQGDDVKKGDNKATRVGKFLRESRIDELPQLWNVFFGDLSLIGPRPELPTLADLYEKEIRYYNVRHLIKPGLSGWAQIYHDAPPKFGTHVESTKEKLSYDLYYIKNRSFILDLKIALRTLKIIISRSGL
jgi:exopolysaccharide biosynthesis polyprenyl glycosylphosphotransferase